jgi:predicted DNA-binding transcriptional regulator AlpA
MTAKIIYYEDICNLGIKLSKGSLWKLMREGKFPKAIKIGKGKNAWLVEEINQYLENQIAMRR